MKIFITGSSGFVGKNLIEFYADHEIFAHTRDQELSKSLTNFMPDVIINCAAQIYNFEEMWVPNILWTHDCLEHVKKYPTTTMVHIGSSSEYGKLNRASEEVDRINPTDMYQATKGAATLLCQGYARSYNLDISVARPYSVYGKYEKPHRLFPALYRCFMKDVPINLNQGYHDFIFIDDFVRGIDILVGDKNKPSGDIVNFGSGIQYSNLEVLEMFKKVTGNEKAPVNFNNSLSKSFENNIWLCNTTYAKEKYKFEAEYSLQRGIEKFLNTAKY